MKAISSTLLTLTVRLFCLNEKETENIRQQYIRGENLLFNQRTKRSWRNAAGEKNYGGF